MPVLHRYTNLAATIHLLQTRQITLLNPATWDDRNDAYFMAEYKRHKKAETVLALCFTAQNETYHHWRVFSHGTDGVRLEFDREPLVAAFKSQPDVGVRCRVRHAKRMAVKQTRLEAIKARFCADCGSKKYPAMPRAQNAR